MPCLDILISLFLTPGGKLGLKIGTTYSIIIMLIFHLISLIILIYGNRFYLVCISLCIFGLGSGLSHITYMRNCWKYFPDNQGLVNGVIISSSGIISTFLIVLADFFIVNPNREDTINGIYPEYVEIIMEKYIKIISSILFAMDLVGFLLTFDYDKIIETNEEKVKKLNENKRNSLDTNDINSSSNESANLNLENTSQIINNNNLKLMTAFISKTNFQFFSFCFCGFCKYYYNFNFLSS